jgi:hypothetical protein
MPLKVTDSVRKFVSNEREMLRQELKGLKDCQIQFLTGAIVAAGVVLGLPGIFRPAAGQQVVQAVYLVPLVVLLPCWWGFFDKAKSITRIVGYFRVLEEVGLKENDGEVQWINGFCGWENAVSQYRHYERTRVLRDIKYQREQIRLGSVVDAVFLIPSQRYWSLAHYTFTLLSGMCLFIAGWALSATEGHLLSKIALGGGAFVFLYSLAWNASILCTLLWGRHSYAATAAYWRYILNQPPDAKSQPLAAPMVP